VLDFQRFTRFIGWGGVKTAKVLCGANDPFPKKEKIFPKEKKEKRKKTNFKRF